jgi:hypothetical protein
MAMRIVMRSTLHNALYGVSWLYLIDNDITTGTAVAHAYDIRIIGPKIGWNDSLAENPR